MTPNLKYSYPFPTPFRNYLKEETNNTNIEPTIYRTYFYMGLSLPPSNNVPNTPRTIDLTPAVTKFIQIVKEWPPKGSADNKFPQITADIKISYLKQ